MSLLPAALLLAALAPAQERKPPAPAVRVHARPEAVDRVLTAARTSSAALAVEMVDLRAEAIPAAFAALVRAGRRPAAPEAPDDPEAPKEERTPAPDPRETLLAALGRAPRVEVRRFFDGLCASSASSEDRCAILDVVADSGVVGDLASLPAWLADPAGTEEAYAGCVASLLGRDPRGYAYLEDLLKRAPKDLRPATVRGVAAVRSEIGMRTLAAWSETECDLSLLALVHVGRMARGMPRPVDDGVRSAVRRFLADDASPARPEAALVAGELDDDDAVPLLIDLLGDPSKGLRANALWSLRRLSGLGLREEPERWRAWYTAEQAWWRDDSARVLADLRSGSVKAVHAALESIAGIRTGRERLSAEVAARLASKNPAIVVQACVVLGRLGSSSAVRGLLDLLQDPDASVRASARDALKAIEGSEPPEARKPAVDPR